MTEATAWKVPAGLDITLAACVPIPFGTADDCLFEFGRLKKGESVLIQGGAGGVGLAAIQLAKRAGARVFATASSDAKLDRLRDFGMDEGINYARGDLVAAVMRATDNRGVNLVVDPGRRRRARAEPADHRLPRPRGHGRQREPRRTQATTSARCSARINRITGVFLGAEITTPRVRNMIEDHLKDLASGALKMVIDKQFALRDAARRTLTSKAAARSAAWY